MSKNIAVILAGGSGSRFGRDNTPKQFLKVAGKKVIEHTIDVFEGNGHTVGVAIPSVLDYYESTDAISLTRKLRSIVAFQTIKAPMKRTEKGFVPDYESRYFTEDFPFGLQIVKDLAFNYDISTPTIDKVLAWGRICL